MAAHARRTTDDANDTGVEILPGIVVVDLTVPSAATMTADDLRAAMEEARAQEDESNLEAEDLLGDFDINPL